MQGSEQRNCQSCKKDFTIEPDDFSFYEKMHAPPPTWCPECRMIRRFVWRNERTLFKRKSSHSGKEIFSAFPDDTPFPVYERDYWWSDGWDPMEYGREYDFSRPFFEQFREFLLVVPWPSLSVAQMVNSEYCNNATNFKNVYLGFSGGDCENSAYITRAVATRESLDMYEAQNDELCYEGYMVDECYRVFFSINCETSTDIWFSKNLIGCNNCFGCMNLRKKSNCIFNKQVSREEYAKFMDEFDSGSWKVIEEYKVKAYEFWKTLPERFTLGFRNVNSSGEHIQDCKNVKFSFDIHGCEDLKYCQILARQASDSYDYTIWGDGSSRIYECCAVGEECSDIQFSYECWPSSLSLRYSVWCHSSSNLFGCIGLQKKKYCILNKQYTKEEYNELVPKIRKHIDEMPYTDKQGRVYRYGEFFPPEFSPYSYNETIANDFVPLSEQKAKESGYEWNHPSQKEYETTMDANDLPDNISEIEESVTKEIIKCNSCERAYRIVPMELGFYRNIVLPIPRKCHNCRFKDRFLFVNPPRYYHRQCMCEKEGHEHSEQCPNEFETSYHPDRSEVVYCEKCYQKEVI
jgi:hypothetical protein